jgi:exopolyphosphatase/guanosine-5'-triphosphate,3'-diphosphate pyrophosphatase
MSKIGVIDLGTNTFNLLVAELRGHEEARYIHKDKISVKIGEGGITKNLLLPIPMDRAIEALKQYSKSLKDHKVTTLYALATSAIRGAKNKNEFILRAWSETGIFINVVSGDEEAGLIFQGVQNATQKIEGIQIIMDIGGGSTEFILCDGDNAIWKQSFDLGVARLIEQFSPSDPINATEISEIEAFLDKELTSLWQQSKTHPPTGLIGSSGSFDSFAEMILVHVANSESLDGSFYNPIDIPSFQKVHQKLIASSREERLQLKGLIPMRVDMIVIASIMTNYVMQKLQLKNLTQSAFALKEGVLERLKKHDHKWLKSSL